MSEVKGIPSPMLKALTAGVAFVGTEEVFGAGAWNQMNREEVKEEERYYKGGKQHIQAKKAGAR